MGKNELRKDYITEERVIIAESRGMRPHCFETPKATVKNRTCPFCPGNEKMVSDVESIKVDGKWEVKSIKNKFPIIEPIKWIKNLPIKPEIQDAPFYNHFPIAGYHEVIIDTRKHNKESYELGLQNIRMVIDMYVSRFKKLISKKNIDYVSIFKNRGEVAGASIDHPHSQIVATPSIPERIRWEMKGVGKKCVFCDIVKHEVMSERFIYENKSFVAICPYAPKFQYELWILPKRHMKNISEMTNSEKNDLADIIIIILNAMEKLMGSFPYNYAIHQAPKGKDFHFHLEIYPRLAKLAGLELGSNIYVNSVPPEDAAISIKNEL